MLERQTASIERNSNVIWCIDWQIDFHNNTQIEDCEIFKLLYSIPYTQAFSLNFKLNSSYNPKRLLLAIDANSLQMHQNLHRDFRLGNLNLSRISMFASINSKSLQIRVNSANPISSICTI